MHADNWKNIKDVLLEALSLDASERRLYLEAADISFEVREEVKSLLACEQESEDLMHLSAVEFSKGFFDADDENTLIGQKVGVYKIVSELGYGGMGAVYLATRTDGKFKQNVALKLLKREMNTSALRQRFQQEREILASLEHPNIARLLDAGTTGDGVPFIAMEYVEGLPVDDYCNKHALDLTRRLNLFRTICQTVNFAHRNLIVHRDLKPSNILVTADGTPKLLDFGISKILSSEIENTATITNLGVMTPAYASPEQLRNESVTTAADIYSLGVILYELLSGHRPFEAKERDIKEIYQAVIDADPPLPSAMVNTIPRRTKEHSETPAAKTFLETDQPPNKTEPNDSRHTAPHTVKIKPQSLRGDLDNIVLKALKKEPERRYSSAENFSEDIRKHLDGLPVIARPDTFSYRAGKFVKRNSFSVLAGALILLAVIGGMGATLWQARIARVERTRAERRFNDVRQLASSFLFEFSPKIENLPGSTPARQLLVTRALEYLDSLSQETAEDLQLQSELARAYEKVGDVQGNPFNPNIGDIKGAIESYEKARAIRRKLLEIAPGSLQAQSDLAYNLEKSADIQSNGGDYPQGKSNYDEALALRETILARQPQDYEARSNLAGLLKARGLLPFYEGDNKKAIEYYNRASAIYEQLLRERPDDYRNAEWHAYMFLVRGEALGWDGDQLNAGIELQKGLDLLLPLQAKYPNDQTLARSLMLAYRQRGIYYEDIKDYEASIAAYLKGLELSQNSLKADPLNVQAKRDVALGNKKLAGVLDLAGKSKESLEKFDAAINVFKELSAADPNNADRLYDVANTRFSIGETHLTLKNYDAALETFQTSKEEFTKVLEVTPENIFAWRVSSFVLEGIGKSYAALAEKRNQPELRKNALENFRSGLERLKKLKADENLAEHDFAAIGAMETIIAQLENKIANE